MLITPDNTEDYDGTIKELSQLIQILYNNDYYWNLYRQDGDSRHYEHDRYVIMKTYQDKYLFAIKPTHHQGPPYYLEFQDDRLPLEKLYNKIIHPIYDIKSLIQQEIKNYQS